MDSNRRAEMNSREGEAMASALKARLDLSLVAERTGLASSSSRAHSKSVDDFTESPVLAGDAQPRELRLAKELASSR